MPRSWRKEEEEKKTKEMSEQETRGMGKKQCSVWPWLGPHPETW